MTTRLVLYSEFFNTILFFANARFVEKLRIMLTTKRKCDKQKKKRKGELNFGSLNFRLMQSRSFLSYIMLCMVLDTLFHHAFQENF